MEGKIIKGIAGFYYIASSNSIYECKAKGAFRKDKIKPLVGDNVEFTVTDEKEKKGNITQVLTRKNQLIRPSVSNVDQAMIVFAIKAPNPNLNLLDRFLVMMDYQGIDSIVVFNKADIGDSELANSLVETYEKAGYKVIVTSTYDNVGIDDVKKCLKGQTTVFAGPSGVGKSSLLNALTDQSLMETGSISEKIGRGKHTTRHSEIFLIDSDTFVFDTPGFSSLFVQDMTKETLKECFPEFVELNGTCKFNTCAHINEPDCKVKNALEEGRIAQSRYDNYVLFYKELEEREKKYD